MESLNKSAKPENFLYHLFADDLETSRVFFKTLQVQAQSIEFFAELARYDKVYFADLARYYKIYKIALKSGPKSTTELEELFSTEFKVTSHPLLVSMVSSARAISEISLWLTFIPLVVPGVSMKKCRSFLCELLKQKQSTYVCLHGT